MFLKKGDIKSFILFLLNYKNRKSSLRPYIRDYHPMFSDYKQKKSYTSIAILDLLIHEKVKNIAEIGVFRGAKAIFLLDGLLKKHSSTEISYVGFDLFSLASNTEIPPDETPSSEDQISKILKKRKIRFYLYPGPTNSTISKYILDINDGKVPYPDFIFIDGGHSYQTCKNDFNLTSEIFNINPNLIILFDDFHLDGVRKTISEIDDKKYIIKDIMGRNVDFNTKNEGLKSLIDIRLRI